MDDRQLEQSLHATGLACFINYYGMFSDNSISNSLLVKFLMTKENYTEASSRTKVSQARRIIRSGRIEDALKIIFQSEKLDSELRGRALNLSNINMPPVGFSLLRLPQPAAKPLRVTSSWPKWKLPSIEELVQLAEITAPYIRFLHPDIVRALVDDNEEMRKAWSIRLAERGVEPSGYLWEHSACTFPGVRRYEGKERAGWKKHGGPETLDDNAYPKQIWSFIFQGKSFANKGPDSYSLAHIADHKRYKNRGLDEFDLIGDGLETLPGLYTSITNTVYMPIGLIRPTDFSFLLRNLIQRRANELYGSLCKLLPPHFSIRANESDTWSLNAFHWADPVGTSERLQDFLQYRRKEMERILSKPLDSSAIALRADTFRAADGDGPPGQCS